MVQSVDDEYTVLEDRKYLQDMKDKQEKEIQDPYKQQILMEEEKYVDPKTPNKDDILTTKQKLKLKMLDNKFRKEKDAKMAELALFNPEKIYKDELQAIYKKNMENLITKPVRQKEGTEIQKSLFKTTKDNVAAKISDKDIKMLEKYEKLLYSQNQKAFIRLQQGGEAVLKPQDRKELHELLRIKKQKQGLIDRLKKQKDEAKMKQLEDRVLDEVQRGIRRATHGRHML